MIKALELNIGLRYTRAKRRDHFISFISLVSMLGISLGVWALITVLSVMNGFHNDLRGRILAVASHATVTEYSGAMADWPTVDKTISTHPGVNASAPYIIGQGMITRSNQVQGALIRGVDPARESAVSQILDSLVEGQ